MEKKQLCESIQDFGGNHLASEIIVTEEIEMFTKHDLEEHLLWDADIYSESLTILERLLRNKMLPKSAISFWKRRKRSSENM